MEYLNKNNKQHKKNTKYRDIINKQKQKVDKQQEQKIKLKKTTDGLIKPHSINIEKRLQEGRKRE